jgi:hypothetical protein
MKGHSRESSARGARRLRRHKAASAEPSKGKRTSAIAGFFVMINDQHFNFPSKSATANRKIFIFAQFRFQFLDLCEFRSNREGSKRENDENKWPRAVHSECLMKNDLLTPFSLIIINL